MSFFFLLPSPPPSPCSLKFLQDIAISPVHQQDHGQRHCVGRLCYSKGSKWLTLSNPTPDMNRLHSCIGLHMTGN